MTTSVQIAREVLNELDRGSFLWRPDRQPETIRAKIQGADYIVNRHGNELRFYHPSESHRWLSVPIEIHIDGQVTAIPSLGTLYFSSSDPDAVTQRRIARAGELVNQALIKLGYGPKRARAMKAMLQRSPPKSSHAQIRRDINQVLGATYSRRRK